MKRDESNFVRELYLKGGNSHRKIHELMLKKFGTNIPSKSTINRHINNNSDEWKQVKPFDDNFWPDDPVQSDYLLRLTRFSSKMYGEYLTPRMSKWAQRLREILPPIYPQRLDDENGLIRRIVSYNAIHFHVEVIRQISFAEEHKNTEILDSMREMLMIRDWESYDKKIAFLDWLEDNSMEHPMSEKMLANNLNYLRSALSFYHGMILRLLEEFITTNPCDVFSQMSYVERKRDYIERKDKTIFKLGETAPEVYPITRDDPPCRCYEFFWEAIPLIAKYKVILENQLEIPEECVKICRDIDDLIEKVESLILDIEKKQNIPGHSYFNYKYKENLTYYIELISNGNYSTSYFDELYTDEFSEEPIYES